MAQKLEHIRRWFTQLPRRLWAGLVCCTCLAAMCYLFYYMLHFVTVTCTDGTSAQVATLAVTPQEAVAAAGMPLGRYDDVQVEQIGDNRLRMHVLRAFTVDITADGSTRTVYATGGTVAQLLQKNGVPLTGDDYAQPAADTPVTEETGSVAVYCVSYKEATYDTVLPYETVRQTTSLFYRSQDRVMTIQQGRDGYRQQVVRERYVNGELESYEVISEGASNREAVTEILKSYEAGAPVSSVEAPDGVTVENGVPSGDYVLFEGMKATGYSAARGMGSSGLGLYYGTFAVDPTLIPYGTKVYIASADGRFVYGWAIATDTGMFIHNNRWQVDLFYETYAESAINGVQTVNVYVPWEVAVAAGMA